MDIESTPQTIFRQNSRSFSLAARFFAPADQLAVARMYCFCRYLDDLADSTRTGDASALSRARHRLTGKAEAPPLSVEADFMSLSRERSIPLEPALELVDALTEDCGARSLAEADDLVRFAYGVAGTVGRMMRYVIGARDARADAFAIDLGIGLQLSNVIRDIAEDAEQERFYLPADWVAPERIRQAMAGNKGALEHVDHAIQRALDLSDVYYQSARRGLAYIPTRNRRVVFLAAAFYQAIGQKVARSPQGSWRRRTVVGSSEKLAIALRSPFEYRKWQKSVWSEDSEPIHDSALHRPLAGRLSSAASVEEGSVTP